MDPRLTRDVRSLTTALGRIIREREGTSFFLRLETLRRLAKAARADASGRTRRRLAAFVAARAPREALLLSRAFTLYFQLVNLAEERHRIERLRDYDRRGQPAPHSWEEGLSRLARSAGRKRLKGALERLSLEPVFTAHPTEAKRPTVLRHLARLSALWDDRSRPDRTFIERQRLDDQVLETLESLWRTRQTRTRRITVGDEARNVLHFLTGSVPAAVASFWEAAERSAARWAPGTRLPAGLLRFGNWVGGDRDGNPFVNATVSRRVMEAQRREAIHLHLGAVRRLSHLLTGSEEFSPAGSELHLSLARDRAAFPELAAAWAEPGEVWRAKLWAMELRLRRALSRLPRGYRSGKEFSEDVALLERSLGGFPRAAQGAVRRLGIQAEVFGFHLARLDFRQHAGRVREAAQALLGFWPEEDRWPDAIRRAGASPLPRGRAVGAARDLRALAALRREFGPASADHFIISMTRGAEDLWAAFFLARREGLAGQKGGIDLVPLFETGKDLERAPEVMEKVWAHPLYRRHLEARSGVQEIMLGYSDSNKDAGYLAANAHLYKAQLALFAAARGAGVRLRFFHGIGGTIDRGGAPAYRAIRAAPASVPDLHLRITEQGEVLAFKYARPELARRNLEQMANAVLSAALDPRGTATDPRFDRALSALAEAGRTHYQKLVREDPGFALYFSHATPIDVLERASFASRPTFRGGARSLDQMRAIPWVFAWTQSRHLLPAWYGSGSALDEFAARTGGPAMLREMYGRWPFFAALLDNLGLSLSKTDMTIAAAYADLVPDHAVRDRIFGRIEAEHAKTLRALARIRGGGDLLSGSPILRESIRLRNPYVDSLNALQIHHLSQWRKAMADGRPRADLLRVLLLTVNGIAAGMKSTG